MGALRSLDHRSRGGSTNDNSLSNPAYDIFVPGIAKDGTQKVMTDVITPGFRSIIARGGWVNNPMSSIVERYTPYNASYYRSWPKPNTSDRGWEQADGASVAYVFGALDHNRLSFPFSRENLNKVATINAWKKVEPAKSQLWVTTAEAGKSWDTIYDRVRKLSRVVDAVRRKDVKALESMFKGTGASPRRPPPRRFAVWDDDGRPLLTKRGKPKATYGHPKWTTNPRDMGDEASSLWLEYRYGWSPMVHDIVDTLKAVYAADLRGDLLSKDTHLAVAHESLSQSVTTSLNSTVQGLTYQGNLVANYEYSVRAYIHYKWSAPDGMLRRLNDFGLFDVPRAFWELVPFSFIVDWFVPVGDWLGALTPKIGVEILCLGNTTREKVVASQTLTGPASQTVGGIDYPPICPIGSKDQFEYTQVVRSPFLSVPGFPPIDVSVGIKRMADAAALFKRMR